MIEPVILSACRTPIGKFQGALASVSAAQLGAAAVRAAVERARLRPEQISEVILGNVLGAGVGQAPARQAALEAGLPPTVGALTINKVCGSGLKAIMLASQAIRAGDADVIVAGGMESMSRAPYVLPRGGAKFGNLTLVDTLLHDGLTCARCGCSMGEIADKLAAADKIGRERQDAYAAESHLRAVAAQERGDFRDEIVPVKVRKGNQESTVDRDEGPRPDSTAEALARLAPAFGPEGTVTAGNASMVSDGAAAVVVASYRFAEAHGLEPLARIVATATVGSEPANLFLTPAAALQQAVAQARLVLRDLDAIEINEAFAVQMLACLDRLKVERERVNVQGGAIALGHPIGASGARVVVTLLHGMRRRNQRRGAAALCLGGGNAVAGVFESP